MSAVIDAAVLVAATSDGGAPGIWAEEILAGGGLVAPHLALVEATNILRRLELVGKLDRLEAGVAAKDLLMVQLDLVPFGPFAERVWQLRSNITSYDAWYIAVAERLNLPLATLDRALAKAPGIRCEMLLPPYR